MTKWPLRIKWPPGTPAALLGPHQAIDLNTDEIISTYENKEELEQTVAALWALEMIRYAESLGGIVGQ